MPDGNIPDTISFLYLGLGTTFVLFFGYIASLFVRQQNLKKDLHLIEQLIEEE